MLSEAKHLWSIRSRPLVQSDPRFFASLRMTASSITSHHPPAIFFCGTAIQISLQNHLRRDLVNVAAGVPSFLAGVAQCTVGCDRRESFVPCDDGAGQNRPQLFHELENFSR